MNDNLPHIELPEFATVRDRLAHAVEVSRRAVSMRVGYEVEVASLEPNRTGRTREHAGLLAPQAT
jgi:hypothetical protein